MSSGHPLEFLPLIAEGEVPEPSVRAHVATCSRCSEAVDALSSLDLGYVWAGITAELPRGMKGRDWWTAELVT